MFISGKAFRFVILVLCFEIISVSGQQGTRRLQRPQDYRINPQNDSVFHLRHENAGKRSTEIEQHKEIEYRLTKLEMQVEDKAKLLKELEYKTIELQSGFDEMKDKVINEDSSYQIRRDVQGSEDSNTLKDIQQRVDRIDGMTRTGLGVIEILHRDISFLRKSTSLLLQKLGLSDAAPKIPPQEQTDFRTPQIPSDLFKVPANSMSFIPQNCKQLRESGEQTSGIYFIRPEGTSGFAAVCDMETHGGGWTYILNRYDGSQNFFLDFLDYKTGFGNLAGEFWLGLDHIYELTGNEINELLVELVDQSGQKSFARYAAFSIGNKVEGYTLKILGGYNGNAGDSLKYHAGSRFSTRDLDQDGWMEGNCAIAHSGAWWYKSCDKTNLNGKYIPGDIPDVQIYQGMYWDTFGGPQRGLSQVKMMVRPRSMDSPMIFPEGLRENRSV